MCDQPVRKSLEEIKQALWPYLVPDEHKLNSDNPVLDETAFNLTHGYMWGRMGYK